MLHVVGLCRAVSSCSRKPKHARVRLGSGMAVKRRKHYNLFTGRNDIDTLSIATIVYSGLGIGTYKEA